MGYELNILGYVCEIQYIRGLENTVAYLLSQIPGECKEDNATEELPDINDKALQVNLINLN